MAIAVLALGAAAAPAAADILAFKARFDAWAVYTYQNSRETVCYAVTKPYIWGPAEASGANAFVHIATRKKAHVSEEVSISFGLPLGEAAAPEVIIERKHYALVAHGDRAFAADARSEAVLVTAMKRGRSMRVEALSRAGSALEYRYSLKGVADALAHAAKVCK